MSDSVVNNKNKQEEVVLDKPTLLHCFCVDCNQIVVEQERVPNDVLEMSFFKLIEQFFYNKKVSVSSRRT